MKKIISIILCFVLLSAVCMSFSSCFSSCENTPDPKEAEYVGALTLLANCDYVGAKAAFEKLGDYKDSLEYLSKFYYMPVSFEYDLPGKKSTNDVAYNSKNLPISELTIRADAQGGSEFIYDEKGNLIKQIVTKNTEGDPEISYYDYIYDSNGEHRIKANAVFYDGSKVSYTFEYDAKGNIIRQTYEDVTGMYEYLSTYDENGYLIVQEGRYGTESYSCTVSYSFDDKGRVVRELYTYMDDRQESFDYTYDAKGNLVKQVYTDFNGDQNTYDFGYDEHGNVISEVFTDYDGSVYYVKTQYELLYIPCGITDGTEAFFRDFWGDRL